MYIYIQLIFIEYNYSISTWNFQVICRNLIQNKIYNITTEFNLVQNRTNIELITSNYFSIDEYSGFYRDQAEYVRDSLNLLNYTHHWRD